MLQSMGSQRVVHDSEVEQQQQLVGGKSVNCSVVPYSLWPYEP